MRALRGDNAPYERAGAEYNAIPAARMRRTRGRALCGGLLRATKLVGAD
ncbi:MAG TPA: hypothetical protein VE775_03185 [Pyrinomonadaceae bacterium]|nr:hypothetical protein [Pyrinomonadaceae bacterium]